MQLDENGIIIEISAKEEDVTTEEEAAPAPEDMGKEADKKMQEMTEAFEAQIAEIKAAKEVSDAKVLDLENKVKQGFAQVAELIEALSNTPSADPISTPNSFNSFIKTNDIKGQRLEKYRNAILNTKN
jgi:hypothetical protein